METPVELEVKELNTIWSPQTQLIFHALLYLNESPVENVYLSYAFSSKLVRYSFSVHCIIYAIHVPW